MAGWWAVCKGWFLAQTNYLLDNGLEDLDDKDNTFRIIHLIDCLYNKKNENFHNSCCQTSIVNLHILWLIWWHLNNTYHLHIRCNCHVKKWREYGWSCRLARSVSTFLSVTPLTIFNKTWGHFPACGDSRYFKLKLKKKIIVKIIL